ncbi:hypothetical protein THAOC_01116 [Thalassiosira oceanica]|uniref:Uncharacterized protein n=1 Tax=Thalassiosira oceanica TaxID=159749 RepID=K0THV0_THAOC|nr:hypothetical protein THAOC_01116 [Thalassiosira oceanica]|eukprot:EJK77080.1 hypothetical protein THAOC_01116 [Thalassiosira oceanica]
MQAVKSVQAYDNGGSPSMLLDDGFLKKLITSISSQVQPTLQKRDTIARPSFFSVVAETPVRISVEPNHSDNMRKIYVQR